MWLIGKLLRSDFSDFLSQVLLQCRDMQQDNRNIGSDAKMGTFNTIQLCAGPEIPQA